MSGLGCQVSWPPTSMAALTESGWPIAPSSIAAPPAWWAAPTRRVTAGRRAAGARHRALGSIRGKRLLGVDLLAGGERLAGHGGVHERRRQVEDAVGRGLGDELVDADDRESAGLPERLGLRPVEIGACDDLVGVERAGVL